MLNIVTNDPKKKNYSECLKAAEMKETERSLEKELFLIVQRKLINDNSGEIGTENDISKPAFLKYCGKSETVKKIKKALIL
jgi:hypothetical protein